MIAGHSARSDFSRFLLPFQGSVLQNTDHVACEYAHSVLYWSVAHNCRENQNDLSRKSEWLHHPTGYASAVCGTFEMTYVWCSLYDMVVDTMPVFKFLQCCTWRILALGDMTLRHWAVGLWLLCVITSLNQLPSDMYLVSQKKWITPS